MKLFVSDLKMNGFLQKYCSCCIVNNFLHTENSKDDLLETPFRMSDVNTKKRNTIISVENKMIETRIFDDKEEMHRKVRIYLKYFYCTIRSFQALFVISLFLIFNVNVICFNHIPIKLISR